MLKRLISILVLFTNSLIYYIFLLFINDFENKLYRTNAGNNEKVGPGITLKVMAGDKVYIKAESFYQQPGGSGVGSPIPLALSALANALIGTPVVAAGKSVTTGTITANPVNATELTQFLQNDRSPANTQTPRAYLNWVLFDEQFQFVAGGTDPVNPDGGYKLHTRFVSNPVEITKNGYLFVYCSNESDINVFFDNLQLTHIQGHLQQEDTYYPFGMGIMAMSSKAANGLQNAYKYNGIAEEDNFDLGLYAAYYRTLDPQLGRWWQTDPANQFASPYLSMGNNPVNYTDPGGGFAWGGNIWQWTSTLAGFIGGAIIGNSIARNTGGDVSNGTLTGAIGGSVAGYFGYGLAASVNWGNVAGALGAAGSWIGQQVAGLVSNNFYPFVIAKSSINMLGGPDASFAFQNPENAGIGEYFLMANETVLWNTMKDLVTSTSTGALQGVALDMMGRFKNNVGGVYENPVLNEAVANRSIFQDYARGIELDLQKTLQHNKGDIMPLKRNPLQVSLLAFNTLFDTFKGLKIIMDQVSYVEVEALKYKYNSKTGAYHLKLRFNLYDDFGLDDEDVRKYGALHFGFQAWWVLQHIHHHKTFQTKVKIVLPYSNNIK